MPVFFFFNDTATTEIYTLSLHDALPISEFYRGETARMIADEMARLGGLITKEDLASYQPKVREAFHAHYELERHNWDLLAAPTPSSGGAAVVSTLEDP